MKRVVLASFLVIVSVSAAFSARRGIPIPDDVRTKISAYVATQKPLSPTPTGWKRGRKIADDAELRDIPADWGKDLTKYKYVYSGNRVWFVDPASRKAVDVIKVTP